jgi:branched-chain amino acid transport system ATP-binding protein
MSSLLMVKNLAATYGHGRVLHGISLEVREGEITALLGANGAGKTSTLRAISGMLSRSGEITLAGQSLLSMAPEEVARCGVAHVPDGRGTFVRQSVEENLHLGAALRRDKAAILQDIDRVYGYFPVLEKRRRQQAGTLSGGEQQMLAVGRALMLRPRLMLLDEPSFGLAPLVVAELFGILRKLNAQEKLSILLVEQNASLALATASTAYLLETGRVVLSGPCEEVRRDETVRRSYLGH